MGMQVSLNHGVSRMQTLVRVYCSTQCLLYTHTYPSSALGTLVLEGISAYTVDLFVANNF